MPALPRKRKSQGRISLPFAVIVTEVHTQGIVILSSAFQSEGPPHFVLLKWAAGTRRTTTGAPALRFLRTMKRVLRPENRTQSL